MHRSSCECVTHDEKPFQCHRSLNSINATARQSLKPFRTHNRQRRTLFITKSLRKSDSHVLLPNVEQCTLARLIACYARRVALCRLTLKHTFSSAYATLSFAFLSNVVNRLRSLSSVVCKGNLCSFRWLNYLQLHSHVNRRIGGFLKQAI